MKRKRSALETNKQTNKPKIQYFVITKEGAPHRPKDTNDVMHQSLPEMGTCPDSLQPFTKAKNTTGDKTSHGTTPRENKR